MLLKVDTAYTKEGLTQVANAVCNLPEDKKFISKIQKLINDRKTMFFETDKLDWGMGEHLAYGSLLKNTMSYLRSRRRAWNFSHRHAVKVEDSEEEVTLINSLEGSKGKFNIYNSLSEYGVLGFDYGYALASPNTLTIWEAQFGDFSNGAQIMIDQYIFGEDKWNNQNGIVMLLPHGYEGQGAEHSSAYGALLAVMCKTQYVCSRLYYSSKLFSLVETTNENQFRKPLIVFTPKSLLRDPRCVFNEDFTSGSFQETIDDTTVNKADVKTLVFVTGKFYYDITAE
jgi:2-oxoglutarate dehydrogenase E1 component